MWWWQSGCRGVPWASRPVRILSRPSRFQSQGSVELGEWCCKVIATRFVLVLNEHLACLVNALLYPEVSYRNRNQDAPAAGTALCPYVRESYWGKSAIYLDFLKSVYKEIMRVKKLEGLLTCEPEEHTLSSMSWDVMMTFKNWPILLTIELVFICPGNMKTTSRNENQFFWNAPIFWLSDIFYCNWSCCKCLFEHQMDWLQLVNSNDSGNFSTSTKPCTLQRKWWKQSRRVWSFIARSPTDTGCPLCSGCLCWAI